MKFLFRSGWGESLAIARRVESEGNLVRFSIVEPKAKQVGDGLITKTRDFPGSVSWADVVVFDSNPFNMSNEAERLRGDKKAVLGSSGLSGQLEHDRLTASDLARKAGLNAGVFERFSGKGAWREARRYLADVPDGTEWVWKHNGDSETASTYVECFGYPEMERVLVYLEELYHKAKETPDFVMCEKIEGIEVSTEAWFNGREWFLANNTIEKNRFFPGDLGEKTGCAGNVVWCYKKPTDSKLFRALLEPLTKSLEGKYNGPIDVNALIEKKTNVPVFLEFTPRFGYDAIFTLCTLIKGDIGGLFYEIATGGEWKGEVDCDMFGGGLRIHTPPYPEEAEDRAGDIPIFGFDAEKVDENVWPCEVKLDGQGEPVTSGPNGYVFVLTAKGDSPREAMDGCEPKDIKIPLMRYREDLPKVLQKQYSELEATGWIGTKKRGLFGR